MNKKFTTFLTMMLAILGFTSAFAQNNNPILENQIRHLLVPGNSNTGVLLDELELGENPGFYQIAYEGSTYGPSAGVTSGTYNYVLGVDPKTSELIWVNLTTNPDEDVYASTFWCVTVRKQDQSQQPKYDYINRSTGVSLQIAMLDQKFTNTANPGVNYTNPNLIPLGEYSTYTRTNPVSTTKTVLLGGDIYGWSLAANYDNLTQGKGKMFSTYIDNKVVGFAVDETTPGIPSNIYLRTLDPNIAEAADGGDLSDPDDAARRFATFRLRTAGTRELNAEEINTLLFQQDEKDGVKLVFNPDVLVDPTHPEMDFTNPFTQNYFIAEESPIAATANAVLYHPGGSFQHSPRLVNLRLKGTDHTYLMVDTAYHNNTGLRFLKFKWDDLTKRAGYVAGSNPENLLSSITDNKLIGQYNYVFSYDVSRDLLWIQVATVYDTDDEDYFKPVVDAGFTSGTVEDYIFTYPYVHIQDLTNGRVLSVYNEQLPTIHFGFENCVPVSSDKTSIPDGVYLIQDVATGKYFASPLYADGKFSTWVEVNAGDQNDQDPEHMPAYQWVVLKDRPYEGVDTISAISMYNREYAYNRNGVDNLIFYSVQLHKYNNGADPYVVTPSGSKAAQGTISGNATPADDNGVLYNFGGTRVKFIPVSEANISNPYLGYRKFSNDSLLVNKYVFNYFNPFTMTTYLTRGGSSADSLLYVREKDSYTPTQFNIKPLTYDVTLTTGVDTTYTYEFPYGFNVTGNVERVKTRIPKLVQLKRTPYAIYLNNETYGETSENRYSMGNHSWDTYYPNGNIGQRPSPDATYVYLKENNHYNGDHYYSLIELEYRTINRMVNSTTAMWQSNATNTSNNRWGQLASKKGGIADGDIRAIMRVEDITETRTSTFRVTNDESPLYRRFNSADENVNKDTTVVLRFVEGYRHDEYLQIENNPSFTKKGIDYLGIWTEERAGNNGISFYVDTAWVNRGAGYIKPQYLILIERETYAGSEAVPCEYEHNHGYAADGTPLDKYTCPHAIPAIPGYTRGKYLVNFRGMHKDYLTGRNAKADILPVKADTEAIYDDTYRWRGYDRAGFLQAIHIQDTLIILNSAYDKYDPANRLDNVRLDSIKADVKNAIFDLRGDHHKYVTWSMRYIEPEKAFVSVEDGKNKTFLIESMKRHESDRTMGYIEPDIAPEMAQWIKMQNGALVLSDPANSYFNQMRQSSSSTGGDDALIFDVEVGSENEIAKDNEDAFSANVVVIGGNGSVTVKNAAGKAVVITNVLGQTIANTVVSSDNATISVPQGIVVVSVEGESAVKAIVK